MNYMISNYTTSEVEHTLYLFPFAKYRIKEYERYRKERLISHTIYNHYLFIIEISDKWLSCCTYDEIEIIKLRYFENKSYDYISIRLGYKNHSSVIRKSNSIIRKMSLLL